ncbi:MAG: SDR family oxidoreductase [Alphaproteobacteria bacterium]
MSDPRTILITGASRSIGRALAAHYAEAGHRVFGCARGDSDFAHANYTHFTADITDETAVREIFKAIVDAGATVDLLINNAGITQAKPALLTGSVEAAGILETNLVGAFTVLREAIKHMMRAKHGRIVNFSSINVPLGSVGGALYNASKAGLENLGHTLAREIGKADITINTVGLSLVAGSGMAEGLSEKGMADKQAELIRPGLIGIDEIAHVVDFFASDAAGNITNQIVYFGGVR